MPLLPAGAQALEGHRQPLRLVSQRSASLVLLDQEPTGAELEAGPSQAVFINGCSWLY